ncbi:MAG: type II toxin-antitoxin system mRNA interferase toxin, RelE/StbE family [Proteobacteria bacterium]|jgi:proteic killer suppression protein|nr:type II toxin-antitoxin system mRNA interferase toxin, RelE/StbE family [Pseudomonadota bacterium]
MKIKTLLDVSSKKDETVQYDTKLIKDLQKLPDFIVEKLKMWAKSVNALGIAKVRESKGFHDEPLKGTRKGQRSIRLNYYYRAIYVEDKKSIKIIVIEVNKHDY